MLPSHPLRQRAQQTANRDGKACAILNFNRVGAACYVIRDVPPPEVVQREGRGWLVEIFHPLKDETAA